LIISTGPAASVESSHRAGGPVAAGIMAVGFIEEA